MVGLWFREQEPQPVEVLKRKFGNDADKVIERLMAAGILRAVGSADGSDDFDEPVDTMDVQVLKFNFCGTLMIDDVLIRCYPKYCSSEESGRASFPYINKAIHKYGRSRRQHIYAASNGKTYGGLMAIVLAVLDDYRHNGLYYNTRREREINGQGETDWQATIDYHRPVMVNSRPVYLELETIRTRTDAANFFRQVHMAVLDECSQFIRNMELENVCPVTGIRFPGISLEMLGSNEYILRRLKQEYAGQFLEKRRRILKLLMMYIKRQHNKDSRSQLIFYGTTAMNLVWEAALAEVLDNKLTTEIKAIDTLPKEKRDGYEHRNKKLIDIIEKSEWLLAGSGNTVTTETLRPDTVGITGDSFIIYDAKYYCPRLGTRSIDGQPGLESVTKQYLYHMAYREFLDYFGINSVRNVFLLPKENVDGMCQPLATVKFNLLGQHTGRDVDVLYVDADTVWRAYAAGEYISLGDV